MELFDTLLAVGLLTTAYLLLFTAAHWSACRQTGEAQPSVFEKEGSWWTHKLFLSSAVWQWPSAWSRRPTQRTDRRRVPRVSRQSHERSELYN